MTTARMTGNFEGNDWIVWHRGGYLRVLRELELAGVIPYGCAESDPVNGLVALDVRYVWFMKGAQVLHRIDRLRDQRRITGKLWHTLRSLVEGGMAYHREQGVA